jgi:hypothetical protein
MEKVNDNNPFRSYIAKRRTTTRRRGPPLLDNPKKADKIRKVTPRTLPYQRGGGVGSENFYESGRGIH